MSYSTTEYKPFYCDRGEIGTIIGLLVKKRRDYASDLRESKDFYDEHGNNVTRAKFVKLTNLVQGIVNQAEWDFEDPDTDIVEMLDEIPKKKVTDDAKDQVSQSV